MEMINALEIVQPNYRWLSYIEFNLNGNVYTVVGSDVIDYLINSEYINITTAYFNGVSKLINDLIDSHGSLSISINRASDIGRFIINLTAGFIGSNKDINGILFTFKLEDIKYVEQGY